MELADRQIEPGPDRAADDRSELGVSAFVVALDQQQAAEVLVEGIVLDRIELEGLFHQHAGAGEVAHVHPAGRAFLEPHRIERVERQRLLEAVAGLILLAVPEVAEAEHGISVDVAAIGAEPVPGELERALAFGLAAAAEAGIAEIGVVEPDQGRKGQSEIRPLGDDRFERVDRRLGFAEAACRERLALGDEIAVVKIVGFARQAEEQILVDRRQRRAGDPPDDPLDSAGGAGVGERHGLAPQHPPVGEPPRPRHHPDSVALGKQGRGELVAALVAPGLGGDLLGTVVGDQLDLAESRQAREHFLAQLGRAPGKAIADRLVAKGGHQDHRRPAPVAFPLHVRRGPWRRGTRRTRRAVVRDRPHRGQQPVAAPVDALDVARRAGFVAERPPQFLDRRGQGQFADDRPVPDRREERVLGQQLAVLLGERQQHPIGLVAELERALGTDHALVGAIDHEIPEGQVRRFARHVFLLFRAATRSRSSRRQAPRLAQFSLSDDDPDQTRRNLGFWKNSGSVSFHKALRMAAAASPNPLPAPAIPSGRTGRKKMIRNSLFAVAASLMTLGTFASTIAIVTAGSSAPVQQIA